MFQMNIHCPVLARHHPVTGHPTVNRRGSCSKGLSVGDTDRYNNQATTGTIQCVVCYNRYKYQDDRRRRCFLLHLAKRTQFLKLNCNRLAHALRKLRVDPGLKETLSLCVTIAFHVADGVFLQMNIDTVTSEQEAGFLASSQGRNIQGGTLALLGPFGFA